jgi:predicted DNA-binding transcriptional regulator AlpA
MNTELLMDEIKKANISLKDLYVMLNISRSSLYRKLTGKTEFTRSEVEQLSKKLNLSKEKIYEIFFR